MDGREEEQGRLKRLITFLPFNLVEEVVVDHGVLEPRIRWVEGCLLSATLSRVRPRVRKGAAAADEELERSGAELAGMLQHLLEEAVFPRGGYLLKFSDAGILVMFTSRHPGEKHPSADHGGAHPAIRAARCGVELLLTIKNTLPGHFTAKAGAEFGRFRLALCGRPGTRLEQLPLGLLCHTVGALRDAALPGELVAGPHLLARLEGCGAHIGPQRQVGRRVVSIPEEAAAPRFGLVNLEDQLTQETARVLRVIKPAAVAERVDACEDALIGHAELRPVAVAAIPLRADYPDDAEDSAVLVDLSAGVETILSAVEAHGGRLLRLDLLGGGHAAMAAFGFSTPLRKGARDAIQCALWLARRMAKKRSNWRIRAGVETGRAYLGEIGSPLKREIALVGGPAAVALDLAQHAEDAQVLVGETAWRLVSGHARGRSLGTREVGEPPGRCGIFEVLTMEPPAPARAVTPSPPRGSEPDALAQSRSGVRARLLDMLQRVIVSSQGCTVVLHGPPGRGKSSLLSALAEHGARLGFGGHVVRCPAEPGLVLPSVGAHLIREVLGVPSSAAWPLVADYVRDELVPSVGEDPSALDPLLGLLGLREGAAGDAMAGMDLVLKVLDHRSRQTPLVLGVEDLENADAQSLTLVARIMAAAPTMAVMVAATVCSDDVRVERFLRTAAPHWVAAPPLGRSEAKAVFLGFLGPGITLDESADKELDQVLPRAAGNPSLLRELAELVKSRVAAGRSLEEACRELLEISSPTELSQLRLDALSAPQRDLARLCSVLGVEFESVLLWRVLKEEDPARTVGEMLLRAGELVEAGILSPTLVGQVAGYRFRERALRDVAYRSWPVAMRTRWHGRAAAVLTKAALGELNVGQARLALHHRLGELPLKAVPFLVSSAANLESRGELDGAREALCQALSLMVDAGPRELRPVELALARLELRLGSTPEAQRWAGSVADDPAADVDLRVSACLIKAQAALDGDDAPAAITAAETGRRLLGKRHAPEQSAFLHAVQVQALLSDGEMERAARMLDGATAEMPLDLTGVSGMQLVVEHVRAELLFAEGQRVAAERLLEDLVRRAEKCGSWLPAAQARALLGERWICIHPANAVAPLRAALTALEVHGQPRLAAACRWDLARALLRVSGSDPGGVHTLVQDSQHEPTVINRVKALAMAVKAQMAGADQRESTRLALRHAASITEQLAPASRVPVMLELARATAAMGEAQASSRWMQNARTEAVQARRRDLLEDVEAEGGREGNGANQPG